MDKVVVLTGAGMSADSGISTFRDSGGLWEGYDINEVATPEGWERNPGKVLEFYNIRRRQVANAEPNQGHKALAELEKAYDVTIITQNIDDLHERAGSSDVVHLHGEIMKSRSSADPDLIVETGARDIHLGDKADDGHQLRPHVVWFGEMVPEMERAARITSQADILLIIGTSLVVYPAAGLVSYAPSHARVYVIDPNKPAAHFHHKIEFFQETASEGTPRLVNQLLEEAKA